MEQLEANLSALDLTLSPEHEARLTEVSAPRLMAATEDAGTLMNAFLSGKKQSNRSNRTPQKRSDA